MHTKGSIQYLTHKQIDKVKWDAGIAASPNGMIYGYSWYLDHMAKHWDAMVLNDYEAMMPLPWNKKYGIAYLYQPPFTQQLGIFSPLLPAAELVEPFVSAVKKQFRFAELFLNFNNAGRGFKPKKNFILSLNDDYALISKAYNKDATKNIRRAEKFSLHYHHAADPSEAIAQYKKHYANRTKHILARDYQNFQHLCELAAQKQMLVLRKATDEKGSVQALALLLQDHKRLHLLQSTTLPEGRHTEANYFLLNSIIREFSHQDLLLDFEGSDIEGIAHFYKNFGAVDQPYYFLRYNRLPWPLRLFK